MSEDSQNKHTTILKKYPTYRDDFVNGTWKWIEGRQIDDNAEGLWRVHDKLYDLEKFVAAHPGGREWLTLTKGLDITEAFEAYHLTEKASKMLKKYYVKEANLPRNYKFTFKDDGFYRTLKRRAAKVYEKMDKSPLWKSKIISDLNLFLFFFTSLMFVRVRELQSIKIILGFLAPLSCVTLMGTAHNFIHQRNNWRMYLSVLIGVDMREWRVFHAFSHHLYPNTLNDLEISGIGGFIFSKSDRIVWHDFLVGILPLSMLFFGGDSTISGKNFLRLFYHWNWISFAGSLMFNSISINAGHHGKTIVHEGDEFKELDFGIYQISAVIDRKEANSNIFMTLTHFGNHLLHHMFPALDHSLLPQFRAVLFETMNDFKAELREFSLLDGVIAQFQQLGRNEIIKLTK
ncbi:CLUMA_CG008421, isoform A [Clunio marinus]|uniref:Cytochrome b5-related protein n=1 Tax=Clunio marinus TaxID=568069 RepID=A0A1J1I5A1_9DIPT|nr:CLUMA_CG008421, isoform A [Clunio marinus]